MRRQRVADEVAEAHSGVAKCSGLVEAGISRAAIRAEIEAERWTRMGRHTVGITTERDSEAALRWRAVWESGVGVVLDGVTSLQAAGLTGWSEDLIHVSVPGNSRVHAVHGVRAHRLRRVGHIITAGIPRTRPDVAVILAAMWAGTDRQAATLLAMTMQQRLAHPDRVLDVWSRVQRCRRRALLAQVVSDVCDGAHSLDELDFAAMCRARGLPEPTEQLVRKGRRGRVYLDVGWEDLGVHVEIDGAQHAQGLNAVDDALRHNDLAVDGTVNLRIPVLGLRLRPDDFMGQVLAALDAARLRMTLPARDDVAACWPWHRPVI